MHLSDLRIDEIVKVKGLPRYARGRATFTNGRSYDFDAHFAHGCEGRPHLRLASHRRQGDGSHDPHGAGYPRPASDSRRSRNESATRSPPSSTSDSPPAKRSCVPGPF